VKKVIPVSKFACKAVWLGILEKMLNSLHEIAVEAGRIAQSERRQLRRELKPDGSIVTNGDRAVETYLRQVLPELVPGTSFWGEEFGWEPEAENGRWAVDPVDGTSNYAFGWPTWGVSIGLVRQGKVLAGAIALPDLNEVVVGVAGSVPQLNGVPISPIPAGPIRPEELVGYCDSVLRNLASPPPGRMRCSGAFVIDGVFTVTQRLRGMLGFRERLYDVAATVLFAQELGAEVRYVDGSAFDLEELGQNINIPRAWLVFPRDSGSFV